MPHLTRLARILDQLEKLHGPAPRRFLRDPMQIALWENVGYMATDERRKTGFEMLKKATGLDPERILAADRDLLEEICRTGGGPHAEKRAGRLRDIAALALEEGDGDLKKVLRRPIREARRILKRLPAIGEPGVDRILLFSGTVPILSLESNGLRVLLRIGYGVEGKSYSTSYRSAREAAAAELPEETGPLVRAWHLLRTHGQHICRNTTPDCAGCPVSKVCSFWEARA
jgi:endonuclease-3